MYVSINWATSATDQSITDVDEGTVDMGNTGRQLTDLLSEEDLRDVVVNNEEINVSNGNESWDVTGNGVCFTGFCFESLYLIFGSNELYSRFKEGRDDDAIEYDNVLATFGLLSEDLWKAIKLFLRSFGLLVISFVRIVNIVRYSWRLFRFCLRSKP